MSVELIWYEYRVKRIELRRYEVKIVLGVMAYNLALVANVSL